MILEQMTLINKVDRGGTIEIYFEGADQLPDGSVDTDSATGWVLDINAIDRRRYFRFRIIINPNNSLPPGPAVKDISFEYRD